MKTFKSFIREEEDHPAVKAFAAAAHEEWRKGFEASNGKGAERIKKNSDGTSGNINAPFHKLHPDWQRENLAAGRAAKEAVEKHPDDDEKAAEHIHNEWMKRNPKADYNAAQHVPYKDLPEEEKEKDRVHVRTMRSLLKVHNEHIVKTDGEYRLVSKKTGKNLGTYPTKAGAEKRERQVQYFKHMGEDLVGLERPKGRFAANITHKTNPETGEKVPDRYKAWVPPTGGKEGKAGREGWAVRDTIEKQAKRLAAAEKAARVAPARSSKTGAKTGIRTSSSGSFIGGGAPYRRG